jgi:hypothetical protein
VVGDRKGLALMSLINRNTKYRSIMCGALTSADFGRRSHRVWH